MNKGTITVPKYNPTLLKKRLHQKHRRLGQSHFLKETITRMVIKAAVKRSTTTSRPITSGLKTASRKNQSSLLLPFEGYIGRKLLR
jgi:hypothetical protein